MLRIDQNIVDEAVCNFASDMTEEMSLKESVAAIMAKLPEKLSAVTEQEIQLFMKNNSHLLFVNENTDRVASRDLFFNKAKFRISPMEKEIQGGYLVVGHRPYPYCNPEILPHHIITFASEDSDEEIKIPLSLVELPLSEWLIFHSLLNPQSLMLLLNEANDYEFTEMESLTPGTKANLPVLDMKAFYEKYEFEFGDAIIATVEDWSEGLLSFEVEKRSERCLEFGAEDKWVAEMDQCLEKVLESEGPRLPAVEQFARAFFLSDGLLLKEPTLHLGGYLSRSKMVSFYNMLTLTTIWYADESPEDAVKDFLNLPEANSNSLGALLQKEAIGFTESELYSYMIANMHDGFKYFSELIEQMQEDFGQPVYNIEHNKELIKQLEVLWNRAAEHFDPDEDDQLCKMREDLLELLLRRMRWLNRMDKISMDFNDLPAKEMIFLGEATAVINNILEEIEFSDDIDIEEAFYTTDSMVETFSAMMTHLDSIVEKSWKRV